jgi:hypothetical protein
MEENDSHGIQQTWGRVTKPRVCSDCPDIEGKGKIYMN